jgi:hypothetical protein
LSSLGNIDHRQLAAWVVSGHEDYLFHRDHNVIEQVTGQLPLTHTDLQTWVSAIETRSSWCRSCGIVFRFVIVPEKHVIYPDKLPAITIHPNRPALQIIRALSAQAQSEIIYPVDLLRNARRHFKTYYATDTHWTMHGAFVLYKAFMAGLPRQFVLRPIKDENLAGVSKRYVGDLGVRLDPERDEDAVFLSHTPYQPFEQVFSNKSFSRGSTLSFTSDRSEAPQILTFRDSYFNYVIPHFIPVFSRTTAVGSINMHYDLVQSEKPNIIVFEIAERFLGYTDEAGHRELPDDSGNVSFATFSGVDLAQLYKAGRGTGS